MDKTERRVEEMREIQKEALHLFARKNRDYGDAFAEYGPVGVIVRMGDKIKRLVSISSSGVTFVDNESLRDTLVDLHNYAAMAIMTIDDSSQKENETLINQSLQFNSSGEGI